MKYYYKMGAKREVRRRKCGVPVTKRGDGAGRPSRKKREKKGRERDSGKLKAPPSNRAQEKDRNEHRGK